MTGIVNIISQRLDKIDFTQPLSLIDLLLAITLVLVFLIYMRRYPVFRVLLGILFLLGCSIIFFAIGMTMTSLVFGVASNLILISLPLIFAQEIRHYLEKLGRFPFLRLPRVTATQRKTEFVNTLIHSIYELVERNIGATIVIARKTGLGETIETGVFPDAKFSSKLLHNIFFPKSPLHDGAVVIVRDKIYAAGCLLPISGDVKLDPPFGTRHRSGLSITKDTDAVVILVSEQRAQVTLAENGKLFIDVGKDELSALLLKLL